MDGIKKMREWVERNRDIWFDVMRIYLGLGLFFKGLQLITDKEFILRTIQQADTVEFKFQFVETFLMHYVPMAHLGGGLCLAAGLMTRISTIFQIPVLAGAVYYSYRAGEGIFKHGEDFQFTALVLVLLILILLHGAGRLSVDHHLRSR